MYYINNMNRRNVHQINRKSYSCNATAECVEQRRNCDGIEDCSDGSDEWDCGECVLVFEMHVRIRCASLLNVSRFGIVYGRKCIWILADLIDSTFWDHLFQKRPAARSDDIVMDTCGMDGLIYQTTVYDTN